MFETVPSMDQVSAMRVSASQGYATNTVILSSLWTEGQGHCISDIISMFRFRVLCTERQGHYVSNTM